MGKYIIEIDESIYQGIINGKKADKSVEPREIVQSFQATIADAIANSKPYKPTGDLISREALEKYARKVMCEQNATNFSLLKMFDEIIDNAPPVDAIVNTIEVKQRGEWIKTPELFRDRICSHCKQQIPYSKLGKFCVECGADMRGGATNEKA